jgi:hypothetical protein
MALLRAAACASKVASSLGHAAPAAAPSSAAVHLGQLPIAGRGQRYEVFDLALEHYDA